MTGSSSGNGRAIALRFAREGAAVVCADVRQDPDPRGGDTGGPTHDEIAREGGRAFFANCDVTDGEQMRAAVAIASRELGRLDIAVANAGIHPGVYDLVDEPWELFEKVVAVNQGGVWWTCREAVRAMSAQGGAGRLIVIASIASFVATPSGVAYNASKGAVMQIVRTLAAQVARHGITVNAICPGYIRTAMTAETQGDRASLERALATHPLGRLGEPADVAGAAFYLASDDAAWVTGTALTVDGGYTCV